MKYPHEVFEQDLKKVHGMNISYKDKVEKAEALAYLYYHQDSTCIDSMAIVDYRENILK